MALIGWLVAWVGGFFDLLGFFVLGFCVGFFFSFTTKSYSYGQDELKEAFIWSFLYRDIQRHLRCL